MMIMEWLRNLISRIKFERTKKAVGDALGDLPTDLVNLEKRMSTAVAVLSECNRANVDINETRFNIRKQDENGEVIEVGPGDLNWVRENLKRDGWK